MARDAVPFDQPDRAEKPCPICGKPPAAETAPFCSKRCADVDLHRWLSGTYAVPDDRPGEEDEGKVPPVEGGDDR